MKLIKDNVFDVFMILLGNFLLACAVNFFILPYDILSGGIFGVAIALKPILPTLDTNYIAYFMILVTFVLGAIFLGKNFALKTIMSSLVYPIFLEILRLSTFTVDTDPLLAAIFGGLLTGTAIGIVFRSQASTGGMDVFPLILHKFFHIPTSKGLLIVDSLTVVLGIATLGINNVLIGLVSVFASSYAIDKIIMVGAESSKSVHIISKHLDVINSRIQKELDRGTTIINAVGGYSGEDRDMLMCIITKEQYPQLQSIVHEEDASAFVIVQEAYEVLGEGFMGHRV